VILAFFKIIRKGESTPVPFTSFGNLEDWGKEDYGAHFLGKDSFKERVQPSFINEKVL